MSDNNPFSLGEYHGCLTGDCPHKANFECVKELKKYVAELCREGNDALVRAKESQDNYQTMLEAANFEINLRQLAGAENVMLRKACGQARGALMLDAMVDDDGEPFGTTTVALDALDKALEATEEPA